MTLFLVFSPILAKRFKQTNNTLKEHSLQYIWTKKHVSVGPILKEYLQNSYPFEVFFYLYWH